MSGECAPAGRCARLPMELRNGPIASNTSVWMLPPENPGASTMWLGALPWPPRRVRPTAGTWWGSSPSVLPQTSPIHHPCNVTMFGPGCVRGRPPALRPPRWPDPLPRFDTSSVGIFEKAPSSPTPPPASAPPEAPSGYLGCFAPTSWRSCSMRMPSRIGPPLGATTPCWNCCTGRGCGSRSCAAPTSGTSTLIGALFGCSARVRRNAWCRWATPRWLRCGITSLGPIRSWVHPDPATLRWGAGPSCFETPAESGLPHGTCVESSTVVHPCPPTIMRCGPASPPTCSTVARTFVRCRNCWATRTLRPLRSTPTSAGSACERLCTRRIPGPDVSIAGPDGRPVSESELGDLWRQYRDEGIRWQ